MKKVYFVCIGNAGRSQMAQALYERRGGEARSAGSHPAQELDARVVEAMQEIGLDISDRRPKAIAQEDVEWADVIVSMGCGDACPVLPGREYLDWNLPDPFVMPLDEVRALLAEVERRVSSL